VEGQDGGVVTALLNYLLDEKMVDQLVVVIRWMIIPGSPSNTDIQFG
jgi:coenzyme F420-reducing hydrogenase beta subunit